MRERAAEAFAPGRDPAVAAPPLRRDFNAAARRPAPTAEEFLDAARQGSAAVLSRMIAEGAPLDAVTGDGETALMFAAWTGAAEAIKVLLAAGVDSKRRDRNGNSVVHRMIRKGDIAMLRTLVEGKANLETRNSESQTALEHAILLMTITTNNAREMFDILIAGGASAKAVDSDGITPVMWAATADSDYALNVLVEKGADIHATGKPGQNALTIAANNDSLKVAKILLALGISTSYAAADGKTARQQAEDKDFAEMASLIITEEARRIVSLLKEGRSADTEAPEAAKFKKRGGGGGPGY